MMSVSLSIVLAQINPTVGDVPGNVARILDARAQAGAADLLLLLPMSRMNKRYMRHFMKSAEPIAA